MFEPIVLGGDPGDAGRLFAVLQGAIDAVDPRRSIGPFLGLAGGALLLDGESLPIPAGGIRVLALGKAAIGMVWGLADALPGVPLLGVAATPNPAPAPNGITVVEGAHPCPDARSRVAGEALLGIASQSTQDDLVVVLVSGGGSACAEVPAAGLTIEHLAGTTSALLVSGAAIDEINTVRRALSLLKGGGLAAAAAPARVVTLILSDVVGNHLPTIAGGPTVADPTTAADALAVLEAHGLTGRVDRAVLAHLDGRPAVRQVHRDGTIVVVGDATVAARGALQAAERVGIDARVVDTALTGEARVVGEQLAGTASCSDPGMSIFAGETTVTIAGPGSGGRNQELALAAAVVLAGREGALVASLGTDGVDGPTRAAGGVADGETVARGKAAGLNAVDALAANDSGTYLAAVGGRLVSGPTGTNVGDVMVAWRR